MAEIKSLTAFLKENAESLNAFEIVISERFKDETRKPIAWQIKIPNGGEVARLKKKFQKRIYKQGTPELHIDDEGLLSEALEQLVIYPSLKDEALQNSYGAMSASELAEKMLNAGEYDKLSRAILYAMGNDMNISDEVHEIKN